MSEKTLFEPVQVGRYTLANRIVMASLTRMRADYATGIANDLHVTHYAQRASAGLLITEASQVAQIGECFPGSAGIRTVEQAQGWKKVTDAVHAQKGRIFVQLWHAGRATHPDLNGGQTPIAPSPIAVRGETHTGNGKRPYPVPREMTEEDIQQTIAQFRQAAYLAMEAGFDGVELHAANGYLIDQFLRDGSNQRTDQYGGSVENRCRFPLACLDALIEVWGADRVGIKLTPVGRFNDMFDSDPLATYQYLLHALSERKLAYVQLVEAVSQYVEPCGEHLPSGHLQMPEVLKTFRPDYEGFIITNNGYDYQTATAVVQTGLAEMVAFGKYYISNPDLVSRFGQNLPLAPFDMATFYSPGPAGYTDYPIASVTSIS